MDIKLNCCDTEHGTNRRNLLKSAMGIAAVGAVATVGAVVTPSISYAAALTQAERDSLTPDQIVERFKQGNERFRAGKTTQHDYVAQKQASASGQFPAAVILSCIDSRAPAEILFDTGIAETFNARIAGNIANDDLLGSMEFACAAAGAKVVLVMGHTACGAVAGAIAGVELGHLTGLLNQIKPAVEATKFSAARSSDNPEFVDAVAVTNVHHTIKAIRERSKVLADLEAQGKIKIVGAMYHLHNGMVEFLA